MSFEIEPIYSNTFTTEDLHRRIGLLQECLEEVLYRSTTTDGPSSLENLVLAHARTVGLQEDVEALSQWGSKLWSLFNSQNMVDQMIALRAQVDLLPTITLYVPVDLDSEATAVLGVWCRENIHTQLLLDLQVDPSVVGGCAVVINDTYHDLSLRQRLQENKGVVTTLLNSYV